MLSTQSFNGIRDMETLKPVKAEVVSNLKIFIAIYVFSILSIVFLSFGILASIRSAGYFFTVIDSLIILLLLTIVYKTKVPFSITISQFQVCRGFEMAFKNKLVKEVN